MADATRRVSVRLSLDDAARVKAGLREVGETGQRSLDQIKGGADRASRSLGLLDVATRGIQIAGVAVAARALVQAGDALTQSLSRLQNATGSIERAGQVYEALYRNALSTGVAVSESVDAFQRFSIAAREIGATSDQVVRLVGGLQRVAIVSGASTQEISSATLQLAQALASGVLQGDELRSILEAMPLLAEGLAKELGVSIGELRKLGSEGKLTAERVFPALLRATERLGLAAHAGEAFLLAEQARTLADTVDRTGRGRERPGQRVGQADGAVELAEEILGRHGQLPEGTTKGERRAVEFGAKAFGGAQQGGKDPFGGELALRAELAQLADRDAEFLGQPLGQQRHGLEDGAQLVALQHARGERLGELQGGGGDFAGRSAGDDGDALQTADQAHHLVGGGADLARGDREALEGVDALGDGDTGGERIAIQRLVDLARAINRAGGVLQPGKALGERVTGLDQGTRGDRHAGELDAADRHIQQFQRSRGPLRATLDLVEGALAGLADLAQSGLDPGGVVQREADRDAAGGVGHGAVPP